MRTLILVVCTLIGMTSVAQVDIILTIDHQFDGQALVANTTYTTADGYDVDIDRLEYYLSEIKITHDGGQVTLVEDTWLLVDALNATSINLGAFNIYSVEAIEFGIGVDEDHNHLDPATWPSDHPLAYQSPSMHWGWSSGYRFVALEGNTGSNMVLVYEIHALGDQNYHYEVIESGANATSGAYIIPLVANYANCFQNVDVSGGLTEHSDQNEAADLLDNMSSNVFSSSAAPTSIESLASTEMLIAPNPTVDGEVNIRFTGDLSGNWLDVYDITGRKVQQHQLINSSNNLQVSLDRAGIYLVSLRNADGIIHTARLVVR
ncbi:MAG: T9SS type A sorting domain-containing protein [Flavobacteriales bacterium]|nr:T9SS type A sorting domain-containing protein [Flavobacteriales bacterium]